MMTIHDLLTKIKWDKSEKPEEYVFLYYDRLEDNLKELTFTQIKSIQHDFLSVDIDGELVDIPLHRIKKVRRKGRTIWERPVSF